MKTLVVYLMAMPETPELAQAAVEAGADVIELGFPFSDPLADGPVIRRAGERSLAAGMRTGRCLEVLAETRARVTVPLIPMTYASIFDAYGWERLEADARAAGATSFIVPDLPTDVRPELHRVQLAAPTSTDERLRLAADASDGWLYLVTVAGTTGARTDLAPTLAPLAARARTVTTLPLHAGFGISTPAQAREAADLTDGIVVGSRAVEAAEQGSAELARFVSSLRAALDA
jgi:tryptophan synthase alpha chain